VCVRSRHWRTLADIAVVRASIFQRRCGPMKAPAPASQFRAGKPQHGARRVVVDQFTTLPLCRQFGRSIGSSSRPMALPAQFSFGGSSSLRSVRYAASMHDRRLAKPASVRA
jgi:hypothetical protein